MRSLSMSKCVILTFYFYYISCEVINIPGRMYPVKILCPIYPLNDYIDSVLVTTLQIHVDMPMGDILVFLTGQEEIENMKILIERYASTLPPNLPGILVLTLYALLPHHQQSKIFLPTPNNVRKVILSTNISETSITIPKIKYIIDTGIVKRRKYDYKTGLESLELIPISKLSAIQRAGRAGRDGPGVCYRLYTNEAFNNLVDNDQPEIHRADLSNIALYLKATGVDDILSFNFIDRPIRESRKLIF